MTSLTAREIDGRLKDILDQVLSLFPNGDFSEGAEFYDHGEWGLALDSIFFALKALHREIPVDLYEKIVSASERMRLFDISHWDAIKPKTPYSTRKCTTPLPSEETSSHIPIRPLYTPADLAAWDWNYDRDAGYPGEFPYTRGVQATMYRGRLWTMRQYAGMGDAEESNKRYKYLLANGTTGLSVAFDLPTQIGLDSDNPLAVGEVGKVGVAIDSIEDMQRLFDGIDLTAISTSMTINATASILLALYVAVARRQGNDRRGKDKDNDKD